MSISEPGTRLWIGSVLLLGAALGWAWTFQMADMPHCETMSLGGFTLMWTVMMAAMMLPALVPVVITFTSFARVRRSAAGGAAVCFVTGYLLVWGLLAVPAWGLLRAGEWLATRPSLLSFAPATGGLVLIACGLYQVTPLKEACLRHCRLPHLFLGHHWRDGLGGALRLGAHHGLYCAGCCVGLMVVLLVVGVMNLAWMVALTAVVLLEKVVPHGRLVGRMAGLALCATGVARIWS